MHREMICCGNIAADRQTNFFYHILTRVNTTNVLEGAMNKKKFKKVAASLLMVSLITVSAAGCGTSGKAAGDGVMPTLRIGAMPYYLSVPLQVIQDEGLDKKYEFQMEIIDFPSGGSMSEALGAGEWDIGPIGAGGMTGISNYNAKLIADVEYEMDGAWIIARPDSPIVKAGATLADYPEVIGSTETVKGSTILGTVGNISHYMAIDYCAKYGLSIEDVNFLNMETSNVYTAFVSGQGDLACIGSPSAGLKLLSEGYVLVGGLKQQGNSQQDCILVSDEFYTKNYEACVRFMCAWLEACGKLNADQKYEEEKVAKFYTEHGRTDFTDADVADECNWNTYNDASNILEKETGAWMKGLVQCYVDTGTMDESVIQAMQTNINTDIVNDALKRLNQK